MYVALLRTTRVGLVLFLFLPSIAAAQKLVTGAGSGTSPSVRVFDASGTDQTFLAYPAAFPGGVRVALGDVTGDGVLDIITGAGPGGGPHVRVWNGTDLTEVGGFFAYDPAFPGGVFVAAGDVNGDGKADIITGAGAGGGPHVRIWDGATFAEIGGFFAYDPAFPGGVNVAAGDVDGDGRVDIVTGAGPGGGPHVRVWSGADFHEIGGFFAYDPAFPGGVNVAAGDVNGDGLADIITGAGPGGGPHVRVWNGASLTELGGFFAYDPAFPGGVVVGTVDLHRDGKNELVTGPATGSPLVRLWTGTTFTLFGEYLAYDPALGGNGVFVGSVAKNPSLDDAPSVDTTTPANGATGIAADADLTVTFSEAVTAAAGAFVLECQTGTPIALTTVTASPATTFTLHPTAPLPVGTACTLRIVAAQVTDDDAEDPPDAMTADVTVSFTTSTCAPITVSPTTVPGGNVNLAYAPVTFTQVGGTQPITWTVSAGTLPTGMMLSPAGVLSGTPTQAGAFPLTLTATATGGCTGSVSLTLNIAAGPNQAPSFTVGANQTALEDAGAQTVAAWATAISPGPPDEAAQIVTFNITGNTNAALFSAGPAVSPTGTLTFTPAANTNGTATITLVLQDNGGTALGGVDTSAPQTFTITVTAVNDAPSFAVGPNQTVVENAGPQTVTPWAIAISPGPANEAGQTVTFNVTGNTNPALFSAGPAVSPTGTLTYTPAPSATGTATISITLQDNGGTANGGVDTSPALSFTITVTGVNSAPSFTVGPNQTVLEDAGAQTVTPWATGITPGPTDETGQNVTFNVTGNTNAALFSVAPAASPTGTLTYTPVPNANGTATITLTLSDDGGTAGGGVDTSAPQTFTITVTAVNDAPSFTKGPDQTVAENSGAHTVNPWATAISAGPADEAGQTLTFNVTGNTDAALFSVGPAVSSTGTLTYTIASNTSGTATITLTLSDNGGTANGGIDTSAPQTFTITVTGVDDPPTADNDSYSVNEGATLSVAAPGVLDGDSDPEGDTLTALLVSGPANASSFTLNPDGNFTYTHNGSETTTDTFTYRAVANGLQSAVATVTITINPVNDAPAITAGATLNYTEGNPATAIDTTILVTDADDTNLESATVQIAVNYVNGQDVLAMPVTAGITSSFNALTGTLTLTGSASVAAYQAALRTVTYFNNSGNPSTAPRTVTWIVHDGTSPSNAATSTIMVVSVNSAPIGATDSWETFGNTELRVGTGTTTTPHVLDTTPANGVLANDSDPEGNPISVTGLVGAGCGPGIFTCATTGGGTVTIQANGTFSYTPQAGDVTSDSFQYILTDAPASGLPASVTVTVNLTLHGRIWYVNGTVPGPGTGTSSDPFSALPATVGDADDYIFVHHSTLVGGITLQNGQKLYGEAFGLSIDQSLNGNAAPAVLVAPGGSPDIAATTGNAVGVLANSANGSLTNVEIRGLTLSTTAASSNAIDITSADAANVAVTISDVVVNGATAEGIDINQGSSGSATVAISNVTVTSTGTGIDLAETAGTLTVTGFSGLIVTGTTAGSGIVVTNATFDGTPGGAYNEVAGGTTSVGEQADPVGGAGIVLTNVSGDLAFTDLDIFTSAGAGLQVSGTGAVNLGAGTGTRVASASGAATLQSIGGPVLDITNATVDLPLASASVTSSPTTGISLVNVASGTTAALVSATSGSITNTTGISVNVNGGTVSLNYGGNITQANNVAMVSVSGGHTTGTIAFSGTLNATDGPGLVFDNADSTTSYNFTGTTTLNGGDAGIDILNGSAGTFTFVNTTITNPTGTAFFLADSNATVTYSGSISDNTGFAVDINNHDSGTVVFATGAIASTGTGIHVANSNGGTINFNSPTIALTTGPTKAVTLDVNNVSGTINFNPAGGGSGLDISTTTGTGFSALGGGTISVSGTGNSITAGTGMALDMLGVTIGGAGVNFGTTTSGGGARNVKLTSVTGGAVALGTGALSGATGAAFLVGDGAGGANTGGTSAITYGGTITTTGTARAVDIQDRAAGAANVTLSGTITHASGNANGIFLDGNAAGTIAFSGANSVLNGGTSTAVSLTNNTGATINFTGDGLDIDTTTGTGFLATGGGTVTVQGSGNTIVANGSGTALNIANTTIGASDVTFQSISAGTGAGTAGTGIFLDTTGALGGLHVTGTGAAGTGGTIRNKTGSDGSTAGTGIYLNNTTDVQLAWMQLNDFDNYGIRGSQVTGFRLTNSIINGLNGTNVASPFSEGSISFIGTPSTGFGLSGSVAILDNEITGGRQRNVSIDNATGTMNINFLRNFVHHTQPSPNGDDGFAIEVDTSAVMFANISNNTFTAHGGDHFNLSLVNNANADLTFANNDLNGGFAGALGQGLFILGASYNGTFKYDISGNDVQGNVQGGAIFINKGSGTGTFSGRIQNNVVGNAAVTGSGSAQAVGIHASARGAGGSHTTLIDNNQVFQYFDRGIVLEAGEGSPTLVATVTANTVSNFADAINSLHGIHFDFGILGTDNAQITLDVRNNLIANAGNEPQGGVDFRMRTAGLNDTFIAGYSGGNSSANAQAFIGAANPAGTSFSVTQAASGTYNNGPAVPLPPPALPTLPPAP